MFKKINSFSQGAAFKANAALCSAFGAFFGFCGRHKNLAMLIAGFLMAQKTFAEDAYQTGIEKLGETSTGLQRWIDPVQKVCYAVAGIVAIVGTISVYIKMNNEEQDVKKSIMLIVGAVIFLLAAATALPAMLGFKTSGANN